ncbi:MAG TPA: hypothetical protein VJ044_03560 [Candidatus Hodarchaeales archaeon]|nr:hypothetical protein [Candidatus Hodarchaeales archaeon]
MTNTKIGEIIERNNSELVNELTIPNKIVPKSQAKILEKAEIEYEGALIQTPTSTYGDTDMRIHTSKINMAVAISFV